MELEVIDISGLPKWMVFAAFYNAAKSNPLYGDDFINAFEADDIIVESGLVYDRFRGRSLFFDLRTDVFYANAYNLDNGAGLAQRVIANVRETGTHWTQAEIDDAVKALEKWLDDNPIEMTPPSLEIMDLPDEWDSQK